MYVSLTYTVRHFYIDSYCIHRAMDVASSVANLDISRVESVSTSINAAFGLHHEDPLFKSDSSSSDSDSDAR